MVEKPRKKPIRAIKPPLKLGLTGVFVLTILILPSVVFGITTYFDFEDYDLGNIIGQEGWGGGGTPEIVDTEALETQSLYFNQCGGVEWVVRILDFEINGFDYWYFPEGSLTRIIHWRIFNGEGEILFETNLFENLFLNSWHFWSVEIDRENFLFRETNETTSTDWIAWNKIGEISHIAFFGTGAVPCESYIDNLDFKVNCDSFQTWTSCQNAGCCWYYSYYLQESFCVECPVGECAESYYECQNCITQENCEEWDFCYWFEGSCRYGTGQCGEGLELQFCENQEDCENAGGYWYDDYCWLEPKPTLLNWNDYYDQYGDYETSSAWISSIANTTGGFFESVGGFLSAFKRNFDVREAYERGKNFGSAIPVAVSFLGILDDFLGGFPIGTIFLFMLIFMLAVGTFRIVRALIQLLKFW